MTKQKTSTHFGLFFAASMVLTACNNQNLEVSRISDVPLRAEVEMVRLHHDIMPEQDGSAGVSVSTLDDLFGFFNDIDIGYGDIAVLDRGTGVPDERIQLIEKYLKARSIDYDGIRIVGNTPQSGSLRLYIERHIVIPPECNWVHETTRDRRNNPSAHFGCATTSNLAIMTANPRDLVDGVRGKVNSIDAVNAANRLSKERATRTETVQEIRRESNTSGSSGSGSN